MLQEVHDMMYIAMGIIRPQIALTTNVHSLQDKILPKKKEQNEIQLPQIRKTAEFL